MAYFDLAKRYHPDIGNRNTQHLMANINAARTIILRHYRNPAGPTKQSGSR